MLQETCRDRFQNGGLEEFWPVLLWCYVINLRGRFETMHPSLIIGITAVTRYTKEKSFYIFLRTLQLHYFEVTNFYYSSTWNITFVTNAFFPSKFVRTRTHHKMPQAMIVLLNFFKLISRYVYRTLFFFYFKTYSFHLKAFFFTFWTMSKSCQANSLVFKAPPLRRTQMARKNTLILRIFFIQFLFSSQYDTIR